MTAEKTYRIKGDEIFVSEANVIKAIKQLYYDYLEDVRSGKFPETQNIPQAELDTWYRDPERELDFYLYSQGGHITELGFYNVTITIPDTISDLKHLKRLDLENCAIKKFPPSFSKLESLRNINLSNNSLKALPKQVFSLKNLEYISINHNKLTDLSPIIENFDHLIQLSAEHNLIKVIPKSISRLRNLFSLILSHNEISEIPEELYELHKLEFLHLSGNKLREISESIGKLDTLEILSLKQNFIKKLPDSIGKLKNLIALALTNNKLDFFSESIFQLRNLSRLYLSDNNIEIIPDSIRNLKQLATLHINNNKLKKIPRSIGTLHRLRRFEIAGNQLNSLPESISKMTDLDFFIFRNNNLTQFPYFSNLNMVPPLFMGYKGLNNLRVGMDSSTELDIYDLLKNLKDDTSKLDDFYSFYFKHMEDYEKAELPQKIIDFVEKKDIMGLMFHYQPDFFEDYKFKIPKKKITKFEKKTKRKKKISSTKGITKFEKNPQSIVKEKLKIFAQMEIIMNNMKKLEQDIGKLSTTDLEKIEKEKKLKKLNVQLNSMKKKYGFK